MCPLPNSSGHLLDSGSSGGNPVEVQVLSSALNKKWVFVISAGTLFSFGLSSNRTLSIFYKA